MGYVKSGLMAIGAMGLVAGASPAMAGTADADAFEPGTDISNAFEGVTLSATEASSDAILASNEVSDPKSTTGSQVFAYGSPGLPTVSFGPQLFGDAEVSFRADFDEPTSNIAIDAIGVGDAADARVQAFATDGTLLATVTAEGLTSTLRQDFFTGELSGSVDTASLSILGVEGIAYIEADAINLEGSTGVSYDNLRFGADAVAIPSPTAAIAGLGMLGGLAVRRRRRA